MHGCISQPERQGLVITEEDYINFLANALGEHNGDKTILNYVKGEFAMSTILFIGYSLSDWNFRAIFKATVESRLDRKDNRSYAVQFRDPTKRESELEQARWDSVIDFWNEKKVDIISVLTLGQQPSHQPVVYKRAVMSQAAPAITRSPADVVRMTPVSQAANGVCYAVAGENSVGSFDLERMIAAVPTKIASALKRKAYYFVPLTVSQGEEILIAGSL